MFEKEAEEYTIENVCSTCYFKKPCENKCEAFGCADSKTYVLKAFKDGAEFGYNKANEWHYVKDRLPKESKKYYVYSEDWGVEVRKFIADAGCFECRNNIIIAWKEIVLPKEIE